MRASKGACGGSFLSFALLDYPHNDLIAPSATYLRYIFFIYLLTNYFI